MAVFKYKDKSGNFSPIQPYKIINYNTTIENTLDSNSTTSALSAYQGNILNQVKLNKSGGTLTGALNFANNTWNNVGDDIALGDNDRAGTLCLKGLNGNTTIAFYPYSGSVIQTITADGNNNLTISGNLNVDGKLKIKQ